MRAREHRGARVLPCKPAHRCGDRPHRREQHLCAGVGSRAFEIETSVCGLLTSPRCHREVDQLARDGELGRSPPRSAPGRNIRPRLDVVVCVLALDRLDPVRRPGARNRPRCRRESPSLPSLNGATASSLRMIRERFQPARLHRHPVSDETILARDLPAMGAVFDPYRPSRARSQIAVSGDSFIVVSHESPVTAPAWTPSRPRGIAGQREEEVVSPKVGLRVHVARREPAATPSGDRGRSLLQEPDHPAEPMTRPPVKIPPGTGSTEGPSGTRRVNADILVGARHGLQAKPCPTPGYVDMYLFVQYAGPWRPAVLPGPAFRSCSSSAKGGKIRIRTLVFIRISNRRS